MLRLTSLNYHVALFMFLTRNANLSSSGDKWISSVNVRVDFVVQPNKHFKISKVLVCLGSYSHSYYSYFGNRALLNADILSKNHQLFKARNYSSQDLEESM